MIGRAFGVPITGTQSRRGSSIRAHSGQYIARSAVAKAAVGSGFRTGFAEKTSIRAANQPLTPTQIAEASGFARDGRPKLPKEAAQLSPAKIRDRRLPVSQAICRSKAKNEIGSTEDFENNQFSI
jgi:hypothetical protein